MLKWSAGPNYEGAKLNSDNRHYSHILDLLDCFALARLADCSASGRRWQEAVHNLPFLLVYSRLNLITPCEDSQFICRMFTLMVPLLRLTILPELLTTTSYCYSQKRMPVPCQQKRRHKHIKSSSAVIGAARLSTTVLRQVPAVLRLLAICNARRSWVV